VGDCSRRLPPAFKLQDPQDSRRSRPSRGRERLNASRLVFKASRPWDNGAQDLIQKTRVGVLSLQDRRYLSRRPPQAFKIIKTQDAPQASRLTIRIQCCQTCFKASRPRDADAQDLSQDSLCSFKTSRPSRRAHKTQCFKSLFKCFIQDPLWSFKRSRPKRSRPSRRRSKTECFKTRFKTVETASKSRSSTAGARPGEAQELEFLTPSRPGAPKILAQNARSSTFA
jgi:hypothetical protein